MKKKRVLEKQETLYKFNKTNINFFSNKFLCFYSIKLNFKKKFQN